MNTVRGEDSALINRLTHSWIENLNRHWGLSGGSRSPEACLWSMHLYWPFSLSFYFRDIMSKTSSSTYPRSQDVLASFQAQSNGGSKTWSEPSETLSQSNPSCLKVFLSIVSQGLKLTNMECCNSKES